jgi:hypothetical protein
MVVKKTEEEVVIEGFEDFEGSPELEDAGVWRKMNDGTDREFLVAYAENPKFQAKLMRLMRPQMPILKRNDDGAFRLRDHLSGRAMAGTVLLSWRGGRLPEFSQKLAEKLLTDRKFRKLRQQIEDWAADEAAVTEAAVEEAAKN